MGDQLDTLSLATAQGWAGLAQFKITQAGITQGLKRPSDFWNAGKEIHGLLRRQLEHLRNGFVAVLDIECFTIKSRAAASLAPDESRRQKIHLQFDRT